MATKLTGSTKRGRVVPDGKRVTFDRGQAKVDGSDLPIKTTKVEKE